MKKQLLTASLALTAFSSFGAGYQLNLQGLRQLAMGGSGTGMTWDASTIFYNPAGLSELKAIQVYGGIIAVKPATGYGNYAGSAITQQQTFTPFNLYVGGTVRAGSRLGLGLGIYTPFGSGVKWDDNWTGRFLVQDVKLQTVFVQPTISYRLSDRLSVGAGFVFANGIFDLKQALPVQNTQSEAGTVKFHGVGNGVGYNVGIHWKRSERFQVGITYRSQVNIDIDGGAATFNVPKSLATTFPNSRFNTLLPLPQVASVGFAIKPLNNERLTMQLDFNYNGWNSFDSLRLDFDTHTEMVTNKHVPRHYRNTLTTRLGACYKLSKTVSLMAGGAYDPTPVTNRYVTPDLPDADRVVVTCGASVKPLKRFTIIAACEFMQSLKRNGSYDFGGFSGTYWNQAINPGIGLYYNF